jgi:hypothetical protein
VEATINLKSLSPLTVRLWSAYGRLLMQLLALHPDR